MINPGAIPQFRGDADVLEVDASSLRTAAHGVRDAGSDVHSTWQGLSAFYEAPEAAQLFAATEPVRSRASDLGGDLEAVAGTLSGYAAEVRPIALRLEQLQGEAASFVAGVEGDDDWREDGAKVDQHNGLLAAVDQQVLALQDAERRAANAERPWGAPEEKDEPWWKDVWNGGVSVVKGFFVDGVWEDLKGLVGFVNPFDWDTFSSSWGGLWSLTGKWLYAPGEAAEAWKNLGKAVVAWDMWSQDPARAFGTVLFNVVTLPLAALKALKVSKVSKLDKAGKADEVADAAEDAGKLPDDVGKLADQLEDAGKLDPDLPTVDELTTQLERGTPDIQTGDLDHAVTATGDAVADLDRLRAEGIPDATRLSPAEQATAARLKAHPDFADRTFGESPHVGAEYVDDRGMSYDAVGTPEASRYWNERVFLHSVDQHLLKSNDYTVVDLTGFTPEQIAAVRRHLDGLPASEQAKIVRIGF
jgi:hypothetical protein